MNLALNHIFQKTNRHKTKKTGNAFISENVSGNVSFIDLTSNHFIDGIRKIFDLEPFIKIHSISESSEGKVFIRAMTIE
jgi:hypothetical protein